MDIILMQPGDPVFSGLSNSSLDQLEGLSIDLTNCIELVSLQQGMKQQLTTDVSDSARTSGRPVISNFTCVKYVDKTSIKFNEFCLNAKPLGSGPEYPSKIYMLRNSGDEWLNIMTFSLKDALISSIQIQSHPNDMPTEEFELNFTEILWSHNVHNIQSSNQENNQTGWSLVRNRPITEFSS